MRPGENFADDVYTAIETSVGYIEKGGSLFGAWCMLAPTLEHVMSTWVVNPEKVETGLPDYMRLPRVSLTAAIVVGPRTQAAFFSVSTAEARRYLAGFMGLPGEYQVRPLENTLVRYPKEKIKKELRDRYKGRIHTLAISPDKIWVTRPVVMYRAYETMKGAAKGAATYMGSFWAGALAHKRASLSLGGTNHLYTVEEAMQTGLRAVEINPQAEINPMIESLVERELDVCRSVVAWLESFNIDLIRRSLVFRAPRTVRRTHMIGRET